MRILSIRLSKAPSVDSEVRGNVVVDYDAQRNPVRLDIMECSLDEFRRVAPMRKHIRVRATAQRKRAVA